MNKSPINYLLTAVIGALFWVVFAIVLATFLSDVTLASKYPEDLVSELRLIFGAAAILSIAFACYWYAYGDQEKVAGELPKAKLRWRMLFLVQFILSVVLTMVIVFQNMDEGIESQWYGIYFVVLSVLTFLMFWLTTFLFSPRTVKFIPFGK